jgi:hypothetical protein
VVCVQKKKEEEAAREKELNELFKVAISQPKVPVGMFTVPRRGGLSDSLARFREGLVSNWMQRMGVTVGVDWFVDPVVVGTCDRCGPKIGGV